MLKKCPLPRRKPSHQLSRGDRTTKIHAVVDGLGNPLRFILTGGQVHDSQAAQSLLNQLDLAGVNVIADKAYGTTGCKLIPETTFKRAYNE